MENEELAALRATLLAAQRQPLAVKVAQARLSAWAGSHNAPKWIVGYGLDPDVEMGPVISAERLG